MKLIKLTVLLIISQTALGAIKLPALVGSNMILQQQSKPALWGWATAHAPITISTSWNKKIYTVTTDAKGEWKTNITTPAAGGPYTITISDDNSKQVLTNILIGEVWFCSGQSNMEMALRGNSSPILNANEIILNADNPQLHLFTVKSASSLTPLNDVKGEWAESTSETARNFSAIAYQFGEMLQKKLHVPVGLIVSSVGGTMIESWMSKSSLANFPVKVPEAFADTVKQPWKQPTALFNGMIAPAMNYGIKGMIWYQGESNRQEPQLYAKFFPVMVADWRKQWNQGDFPFYFVQIAPFGSVDKTRSGPLIREGQLKAMSLIPNAGMASTMDVGMEKNIHYTDKTIPAHRLGYWALGKTYGIKGIGYNAPMLKNMTVTGTKALLTFDNAPYLTSHEKPLTLFEVAGSDKVFYPAKATIKMNTIEVSSDKVSNPVAVRYAFKEFCVGELYNNDGIPASSFRTDDWDEVK